MREEQDKDSHFDRGPIRADVANQAQRSRDKEAAKSSDVLNRVILEEGREEAYDLYLFRYSRRSANWHFAGIYHDGVFKQLDKAGYRKRFNDRGQTIFIFEKDGLISETTPARMRDVIKMYIDGNPEPIGTPDCSVTHAARSERHRRISDSIYNDRSLVGLRTHDTPTLQDTPDVCYVPYLNGVVVNTKDGSSLMPYSSLGTMCIWQGQVIQRVYDEGATINCHFADFVRNVSNGEPDRERANRGALGYQIHSYNRQSDGKAVIYCDQELTDKSKPEGGTGKGVMVNAVKQIRPVAYIDGKKYDPDNKFCYQSVNYDTRVVWVDDVKINFSFERFFSILTSGWTIEKKNGQEFTIAYEYGPKLVICTNVAPNNEGSSNIRRQFIVEFSDFYKKRIKPGQDSKPIREVHGCDFFTNEWDAAEWSRFDRYMMGCVQEYLRDGLVSYQTHNVSRNRLLQTTGDDFVTWAETYEGQGLQPGTAYKRPDLHLAYRTFAGVGEKDFPARRFTNYVKSYAASRGWVFELGSSNANPTFTLIQPT